MIFAVLFFVSISIYMAFYGVIYANCIYTRILRNFRI